MRTPLAAVLVLAATMTATAQPRPGPHAGRTRDDVDERGLTAEQIQRYAAVYYPSIRSCYATHGRAARGATGELEIRLVVHRNGYVFDVAVDAPGVTGIHLRRLRNCVRMEVLDWHFPVRRDFTTAILPYYFMRLNLPNTGPWYGCWNPKGCPARVRNTE